MQTTVYCHHCKKNYPTADADARKVCEAEPESMLRTAEGYRYSGGCYFKTLNRLKRQETPDRPKGNQ
jgi:hypothetical protein